MLTLDNFDQQLPKDVLKKAQSYVTRGAVLYVDQDGDGVWHAEVEGTDTYSVEITLDERKIADSFCDCPVENDRCKHAIAVLFSLREALKKQAKQPKKKAGTLPKKLTVTELVKQVSADELRAFIIEYAVTDKPFSSKLQLHFAHKDSRIDVNQHYTDLVHKLIRSYTDRNGYVDYRNTFKLVKDLDSLLATGTKLIGQQNYKDALTLGMVLLRQLMNVLTSSDDSAGNVSGLIYQTTDLLRTIALHDDVALPLRRDVFDEIAHALTNRRYFDYGDQGIDLLSLAYKTAIKLGEPDRFLTFLDQLLTVQKADSSSFYRDYLRSLRVKFLHEIGRTDEANQLAQANLDVVSIRAQVVDEAIRAGEYGRAKALLNEGIQQAQSKKHPGTVRQWNEQLLRIAEAEQDTDEIRRLTRQFALDTRFEPTFFRRWKATFTPDEWPTAYQQLLQSIRQAISDDAKNRRPGWGYTEADALLNRLGPILIEEKQWSKLLALVQQAPRLDALKQVLPLLAAPYPDEMLALFLPAIRRVAEQANDRADYKNVASLLTLVRTTLPNSHAQTNALITELKAMFPKRPAMQEELRGIK